MSFPNFITHSDFSNMSIKDMKNHRKELISSVMAEAHIIYQEGVWRWYDRHGGQNHAAGSGFLWSDLQGLG